MKGQVIIDLKGEITSSLPIDNEQTNEIVQLINNILQDVNQYMKQNNNQMGELRKTTLLVGGSNGQNAHEVCIVIGSDKIQAVVKEVFSAAGAGQGGAPIGSQDGNGQ
eukprot:403341026